MALNTMFLRLKLIRKNLFCQRYQFRFCENIIRFASEFDKDDSVKSLFTKHENDVMYNHLKLHQNYRQTLAFLDYIKEKSAPNEADTILNQDLSQIPKYKLVDDFKSICQFYCCDPERLNQPEFIKFCEYLIDEIPQLQDDHLLNILKILTLWPRTEDANNDLFYRFCEAVDKETCKRSSKWSRNQLLLTMDHFHRAGVMNFSSFAWNSLGKLCRNPESLTASQLVQTLFLVMCNRRWHPGVNHFEWEAAFATKIYELSIEEVTIVALGFFKTNKKIKNVDLLNSLILKLESHVDTLDSVSLTALLKVIKFSLPCYMRLRLIPLLDKLKDVVDQHSLTCCIYIASLGSAKPVFHEELLNKIFSRFVREISTARLKEIERMIFIASLFSFNPNTDPNFFDVAIRELKSRDQETSEFPKSLIYAVQFLCVQGIFDYDLMNKVLSEDFLVHTFKRISKFSIPCNVVEIACDAILDCPDYTGNNLNTTLINDFNETYNIKSYAATNKTSSTRDVIYMQTKIKLEELFGGSQFVHLTHVLPYSNAPYLIFCRKDNVPVALPEEIRKKYYLDFKPAPKIGDWYAIELLSPGSKIGNTGEPKGSIRSKLRHLKSLGYKCGLLDEEKWQDLETDKVKYLKLLIKTCR